MIQIEGTNVVAVVYQDKLDDEVRNQIETMCSHPMSRSATIRVMPDCHAGAGCVIGFTAVLSEKCIVPNVVGVDIGCGVLTAVFHAPNGIRYKELNDFIETAIPSGLGNRQVVAPYVSAHPEIRDCVEQVCHLIHNEAKEEQFLLSCGTLGGGNHFIEIDHIAEDRYVLAIHTGSRSVGTSVCGYYQKHGEVIDPTVKNAILAKHRFAKTEEEHRSIQAELDALVPVAADAAFVTGQMYDDYIACMLATKDFASANHACIAQDILDYLEVNDNIEVLESFDTVHNYVDWYNEAHQQNIIRKGAISAQYVQRLSIPLNMRDGMIIGRGKGNPEWNCSAPHGAGRVMSRKQARSQLSLHEYEESMHGIHSWSVMEETIDEAPMVYKNADDLIRWVSETAEIDYVAKTVYNFKSHESRPSWKR